ncbi:MAG TPA: Fe-Mn family superoxide dismutase [Candidatus Paceibacterota bacterium]|nr:Fe-Mn family superoxide dismutase [Candidatus Paceibacterota bacterium]
MHTYEARTFDIPSLEGISDKQIEVHLGLYQGYVKQINLLRSQIADLTAEDPEKYAFAIESVRRRLGFEFNGMRMHEFYFPQWEGGATEAPRESALGNALSEKYGSWDGFIAHFTKVGMSRGSGWCTLAWDQKGGTPHVWWTTDHELGMLADVEILLAMDMWEHSYMVDYLPAEKGTHIEAFLRNLNWRVIEDRFAAATAEA